MWTKICLLGLGCCCAVQFFAQGLLLDANSYQNVPDYFNASGAKNAGLENLELRKVSLRSYCPRPRIQGEMASCSGWAAGYAALTIAHAVRGQWPQRGISPSDSAFSPLFIYNQIKVGSCNGGSSLMNALAFLQKTGNVQFRDFDPHSQDCQTQATFDLMLKAQQNRIKDYYKVFELTDQGSQKIEKVKQCLQQHKPVIVALNLLENFKQLNGNASTWFPKIGNTSPMGAHAMVVVGYDDARKAFEVMNSWGEAWGDHGFGWIRYEDFPLFAQFGFLLNLPESGSPSVSAPYVSAFLRRLIGSKGNELLFDTLAVQGQQHLYRVINPMSTLDKIQLVVEKFNPTAAVQVITLAKGQKPQKYEAPHFQDQYLIIPDLYRAIQFFQKGKQWVIVCIAPKALPINEWIQTFDCSDNQCAEQFIRHFKGNLAEVQWIKQQAAGLTLNQASAPLVLVIEVDVL